MRYERGVDDNPVALNADMAAALIAEVSGGSVCPGMVDVWLEKTDPIDLEFRVPRFCAMMGAEIPREEVVDTKLSSNNPGVSMSERNTFT